MTPETRTGDTGKAEILDLRGLKCPLPALFARKALMRSPNAAAIRVITDDPMAPVDISHMCHQEGFEVVAVQKSEAAAEIILRKPG